MSLVACIFQEFGPFYLNSWLYRVIVVFYPFNVYRICSVITSFILVICLLFFSWSVWLHIHQLYSFHQCFFKFPNPTTSFFCTQIIWFLGIVSYFKNLGFLSSPFPLFQFSFLLSLTDHFHLLVFCSSPMLFHFKISCSTRQSPLFSCCH